MLIIQYTPRIVMFTITPVFNILPVSWCYHSVFSSLRIMMFTINKRSLSVLHNDVHNQPYVKFTLRIVMHNHSSVKYTPRIMMFTISPWFRIIIISWCSQLPTLFSILSVWLFLQLPQCSVHYHQCSVYSRYHDVYIYPPVFSIWMPWLQCSVRIESVKTTST